MERSRLRTTSAEVGGVETVDVVEKEEGSSNREVVLQQAVSRRSAFTLHALTHQQQMCIVT